MEFFLLSMASIASPQQKTASMGMLRGTKSRATNLGSNDSVQLGLGEVDCHIQVVQDNEPLGAQPTNMKESNFLMPHGLAG